MVFNVNAPFVMKIGMLPASMAAQQKSPCNGQIAGCKGLNGEKGG